jgi:hypothetical protein
VARFVVSGRTTIAPTATLPAVSVYATAASRPRLLEIGIFNTTTTAFVAAVNRLTTVGTAGAGLTESREDSPSHVALATGFAGHTVAPTLGEEIRRASIGAAVGSGLILTFSEAGVEIPEATTNGVGIICPSGTGQVFDYYIAWIE